MAELGLGSLIKFAIQKWRLGAKITGGAVVLGVLAYFFVLPFSVTTTLVINDAQNSQLQAFTNNFFSLSKTQAASNRKTQTPAQSAADYLDRQDTYTAFAKFLGAERVNPKNDADTTAGFEMLERKLGVKLAEVDNRLRDTASGLRRMVKLGTSSPSELTITSYGSNRDIAYFFATIYSRFALEELKKHEEKEVEQIRSAIEKQRDYFKERFNEKNKELIAFQNRPENVLSLASGPNVGNYISELLVRKNEIELKINENERALQYLGGEKAATLASTRNLGGRSQAAQLHEETGMLRKQLEAISESIRKFTRATNGAAEAMGMHEELKKTTDREFKNFQEANDLLSKLAVYAVSIAGKFELVHQPEIEDVRKAASLYLVLALAVFLSQAGFAAMVYLRWTGGAAAPMAVASPETVIRGRELLASAKVSVDTSPMVDLLAKTKAKERAQSLH